MAWGKRSNVAPAPSNVAAPGGIDGLSEETIGDLREAFGLFDKVHGHCN